MGNNIHILNHPLLQHKLSILRDEHTGTNEFRKVRDRQPHDLRGHP